jgi:hypothetical protein
VRGVEDLVDDKDMVDTRRDPDDRLNSRAFTVAVGSAGMFRWIIGFAFFLDVLMAVSGKGTRPQHVVGRGIYMCVQCT